MPHSKIVHCGFSGLKVSSTNKSSMQHSACGLGSSVTYQVYFGMWVCLKFGYAQLLPTSTRKMVINHLILGALFSDKPISRLPAITTAQWPLALSAVPAVESVDFSPSEHQNMPR